MKIPFMCAGSTVFVRNVIGDMMMCDAFHDMEVALYDLWYSRDLGATADGRHVGDAPKGLLEEKHRFATDSCIATVALWTPQELSTHFFRGANMVR